MKRNESQGARPARHEEPRAACAAQTPAAPARARTGGSGSGPAGSLPGLGETLFGSEAFGPRRAGIPLRPSAQRRRVRRTICCPPHRVVTCTVAHSSNGRQWVVSPSRSTTTSVHEAPRSFGRTCLRTMTSAPPPVSPTTSPMRSGWPGAIPFRDQVEYERRCAVCGFDIRIEEELLGTRRLHTSSGTRPAARSAERTRYAPPQARGRARTGVRRPGVQGTHIDRPKRRGRRPAARPPATGPSPEASSWSGIPARSS